MRLIVLIVVAILIIAGGVLLWYYVSQSGPNNLTEPPLTELTKEQRELLERLRGTPKSDPGAQEKQLTELEQQIAGEGGEPLTYAEIQELMQKMRSQ
ncbi:MAG: hypothetical protein HYS87_01965 [Candidatus Colwellbacteria bacterium]|nr:hypothetical protein [Candidatus Colwellbacteria bacterium]